MLVTTDWLTDHLDDRGVQVVEVDEDTEAYARGHIPGAVGVHWVADLQDPVRRDFVDATAFARLQDRLGITKDTTVVLYGGNNNWFAAYAYWYYRYYQHADVRLLDGGRKLWELEGRKLVTETPDATPRTGYRAGTADTAIRAFRRQVEEQVAEGTATLVDVRSPEEYRGEKLAPDHLPQESAQRPGHIPGAANVPWVRAVNPDTGRFLPIDTLRRLYADVFVTPDKDVIAYCRIGERSAHTWYVLHELLGFPRVRNYDGSWTEWGSLVGVPIER